MFGKILSVDERGQERAGKGSVWVNIDYGHATASRPMGAPRAIQRAGVRTNRRNRTT